MSEEAKSINKSAIKSFAIEARNILIKSATTEAGLYGISEDEIRTPIQKGPDFEVYETLAGTEKRIYRADMRRRENLVKAIQEKGFQEVIEETAYTWFNRLIAIRFMEVNDYLPTRTRVLSSETGNNTPDLINDFLDVDLGMTDEELQAVQTAKNENRYDDAFRLLFIKECNALNDILPGLFKKTDDYMELLLNMPYTSDGVVRMLIETIPEENFNVKQEGQIEIIGWLYQYYNTEPKAKAFGKKGKITKEEIPAVTQLFTPDWIVRYMVENSLGRLWLEGHPDIEIKNNWKFYLDEGKQDSSVELKQNDIKAEYKKLTPEDIKVIDPCMGSGHILVYLFEVLMQIYKHDGYTERDAAELIIRKNLYGLDIDDRAYQLSYFAVMMKARQYNRNIFKLNPKCHVFSIQSSNTINRKQLKYFGASLSEIEKNNAINQINGLLDSFIDGKEYGSIIKVVNFDYALLRSFISSDNVSGQISLDTLGIDKTRELLAELIDISEVLGNKYNVVVTNPPYMVISKGSAKLNDYVKENYPDNKTDLYAVFIEKCSDLLIPNGFQAMITQHSWMFLSSFESLRQKVRNMTCINMAHLGPRAFEEIGGEVVQSTSFVLSKNRYDGYKGTYCRLIEPKSQDGKRDKFLSKEDRYLASQEEFDIIPGIPYAYWFSEALLRTFENKTIGDLAKPRQGLATGDNEAFLRLWFEVPFEEIGFGCVDRSAALSSKKRWFPCNKGGAYRKWYGNIDYIVDWENDGLRIKNNVDEKGKQKSRPQNMDFYFKRGMTWSTLANNMSMRLSPEGFMFETKGSVCFPNDSANLYYLMGLMNSNVATELLSVLSPTLDYHEGPVGRVPAIINKEYFQEVDQLVSENISICKKEWDSYETSWEFRRHPLIHGESIREAFIEWKANCNKSRSQLKENEEKLNKLFASIYEVNDELDASINNDLITVQEADLTKDVKSLISYAVGCMFGRYSLDKDGIIYAGGKLDVSEYKTFETDPDAIIPITDEDYGFDDDIVSKFIEFIRIVYGEERLEENLEFIASAIGGKGNNYKEIIRHYFLNDFYKDHCNTYSVSGSGKRPIYWMFDSGKQNGFKALIYIHRYNPDTVGLIRSTYLHKVQAAIENSLQNAEYVISTSSSATEKAAASKKRDKYVKQLNELRPYYQALSHVALQRIDMDLDDGVKANYQLFQGVEISTEGKKKQKIDLLAKI